MPVRWSGSLSWRDDADDNRPGDREHLVDGPTVRALEPRLRTVPEQAVWRPGDGAVDPVAATHTLLRGAERWGAQLHRHVTAYRLDRLDAALTGVETSAGFIASRTVVLANGTDARRLCGQLGWHLPVNPSPALIMRFASPPDIVRTLISSSLVEVRQGAESELLVAWHYNGESTDAQLTAAGSDMLSRLEHTFDLPGGLRLIDVRVGRRPMPVDGDPVIGHLPTAHGVYAAVMHSGVILAAVVGRLVADELSRGASRREFAELRPERFPTHAAPRPAARA